MWTDETETAIMPCMDMYTRGTFKMENASENFKTDAFFYTVGLVFPLLER
jgi:hypothetical protein